MVTVAFVVSLTCLLWSVASFFASRKIPLPIFHMVSCNATNIYVMYGSLGYQVYFWGKYFNLI